MCPNKGERLEYNSRAGFSKYPVRSGMILKLKKPRKRYNPHYIAIVEHTVYIWVQNFLAAEPRRQPRDQQLFVFYFYLPNLSDGKDKWLTFRRKVRKYSINQQLRRDGFEEIGNVQYNHSKFTYERFYKVIGVLK